MRKCYILSVDQGTTNTRAILFDGRGVAVGRSQTSLPQYFPENGWIEHDPEKIWSDTVKVCRDILANKSIHAEDVAAIGITNQRETTIIWDKETGQVVHHAIVWQDRRTVSICNRLKERGLEGVIQEKTGLLIDPYFSATKIIWLLDHVDGLRNRAEKGEILFGTVDTFLLWRLTGGVVHATDATNASRTMLFNIQDQAWNEEILEELNIPYEILPEVKDSSAFFGRTKKELFGSEILIGGLAGDQQAASIGQTCFSSGMMKSTYGTGCFMLLNTGKEIIRSKNRLLTTLAYRINGEVTYALEGSIFVAGASVEWLRDNMKMVKDSAETSKIAQTVSDTNGVYFVPAFTGLGSPYWDPAARAAIVGMTRSTGIAHIVRATLEAIGYRSLDLMDAMLADGAKGCKTLRVDGGMIKNDWLCTFLADMLNVVVDRPKEIETTALGVAYLAGLQAGVYRSLEDITHCWKIESSFHPSMSEKEREERYAGWKKAVASITQKRN